MKSDEFKAGRKAIGLDIDELSFVINTNARTIRRWEDGTRSVNPVAEQAMRWMTEDNYEPPRLRWIMAGHKPSEWRE